jgi:uncharacterized NAD(P)/FAD-binding protein YdhS
VPCCRFAVLGAGFAGVSVAWHLLQVLLPPSFLFYSISSVAPIHEALA